MAIQKDQKTRVCEVAQDPKIEGDFGTPLA